MEWTTTKPSKPGWYWFRPSEPVNEYRITPGVHMVNVRKYASGMCFMGCYAVDRWTGEWAGPLEPPIDPPREAREEEE